MKEARRNEVMYENLPSAVDEGVEPDMLGSTSKGESSCFHVKYRISLELPEILIFQENLGI